LPAPRRANSAGAVYSYSSFLFPLMDEDTVRYLQKLPLFQGLPEEVMVEMAAHVGRRQLVKDEILFRRGDPGNALYIIRRGWVKIVTEDPSGEELVLNHCGPGEVVGDLSLIDGEPRSAGVVALSLVEALELKQGTFLAVLHDQPLIGLLIMRNLAGRLRFATTYIEKAIELSQRVGAGDYSFAIDQIQTIQSTFAGARKADETRAGELLSAFFHMVEGVRNREETLVKQLQALSVEIDESERQQTVEQITKSNFFTELKLAAARLRQQRDTEESV
jgi:CRP/FNR family transcriptional regulator, cyclic AMP receptor protein